MALPVRIGAYRIVRKLGAGGMGEVLLAHDDRLDRDVAIKRLHAEHAATPERRERFRREARIAARLNHPAIVQIYDVLNEGEDDFLIMEYVAGRTLRERVDAGPLPLPEVLRVTHQIALGMAAAHDLGIIHRDLKAENVLITPAGRAKITDFGIAKVHGDDTLTAEGAVVGTFRAMSPEQALGQEVDHRSDLFSFGILLYEALTGESPFRASTPFLIVQRLVLDTPQPIAEVVPAISPRLASLVHQLLAKEPLLRPRDFHEVAAELVELAGEACDEPCQADSSPESRPSSSSEDTHVPGEGAAPRASRPAIRASTAPTVRPGSAPTVRPGSAPSPSSEPGHRESTPASREGTPANRSSSALADTVDASTGATRRADPPTGPRRRLWYAAGLAGLAIVGTVSISRAVRDRGPAAPPAPAVTAPAQPAPSPLRHVAVLEPHVSGAEGHPVTARLATSIRNAVASGVRKRAGLALVPRSDIDDYVAGFRQKHDRGPELRTLRDAVGADEVIDTRIKCEASSCTITLERYASDAPPLQPEFQLAADSAERPDETVELHLSKLYPNHPARPQAAAGSIDPKDYERYVQLVRAYRAGSGAITTSEVLAELEGIRQRSPRSLDALLFEAEVRRHQYMETEDPDQARRALALLETADKMVPGTYSILSAKFDLALAAGKLDDARALLDQVTRLDPDSSTTHLQRAKLHHNLGELEAARHELDAAVQRDSFSWRVLYHRARLFTALGDRAATRKAIDDLLQRSPDNYAGLSLRAAERRDAGQLVCAEQIYTRLVAREPHYLECVQLGTMLNQLGRYSEAATSFHRALAIRPADPTTLLNLAESLLLAGDSRGAGEQLHALLGILDARRRASPTHALVGYDLLAEAQALAYLGRSEPAQATAARARVAELLAHDPRPLALFTAALVHAVLGDRVLAATYVTKYLERGGSPAEFRYAWFDDLRRDPVLGSRLAVPPIARSCELPAP